MQTDTASPESTTDGLDFRFRGKCVGGVGPNITRYPNLTYAPEQWGEGVRTHLSGKLVSEVAQSAAESGIVATLDAAAARLALDLGELLDSIQYARATRLI